MYNLANIDPENQIRYSTIYGNRITPESLDDITIYNGTDTSYEESLDEFKASIKEDIENILLDQCYISLNPKNTNIQ